VWLILAIPLGFILCIVLPCVGSAAYERQGVLITRVTSPPASGTDRYAADVYTIDCGATCHYDARVRLTKNPSLGHDENETVFESITAPWLVDVEWQSPTQLIVTYPLIEQQHVRKQLPQWHDVSVTYQTR